MPQVIGLMVSISNQMVSMVPYLDIPLTEAAKSIGFLLLDESKTGDDVKIQPNDYKFSDLKKNSSAFRTRY